MIVNLFNHLEFMIDYRLYKAQVNFNRTCQQATQEFLSAQNPGPAKKRKRKKKK